MLKTYCPEMGQSKPSSFITSRMSYDGSHYQAIFETELTNGKIIGLRNTGSK